MSQIERNLAAVFLVFAGIFVNQFSLLLAIAILVVAILVHRGYQMSDLRVNVQNSNRVQTLVSSLYTWTESTVSAVAEKCKRLAVSDNRVSAQNISSPRQSDVRQDYCSDSENVVYNKENVYQGSNLIQGSKVDYKFQETTNPYNTATPLWQRKSQSPPAVNLNEMHNSAHRRASEKDSFSHRDSPWGYSLSPQQRSTVADVRPVQAIAGPLLASAKYSTKRNSSLYVDVSSPGFCTRLLKYSEAATHQPQYARPGQLPLVHLNTSPLPSLSPHNSRKVRAPVRVRIAPPSYDVSESRLFSRNDNQQVVEQHSKSVVDVLKEISRKRIHTEDDGSDAKRHHRSDSSSSSSSSSSPALGNGIITDQTPSGKRPREDDSPKLQKKTFKRTHNNEIYSSLSSSRNICVGTKRKAADNLSRCSTPSPIGKHLKKSPHPIPVLANEASNSKSSEWIPQKQQESLPQIRQAYEKDDKVAVCRSSLLSPEVSVSDPKPSTSHMEEHHQEEDKTSKNQPTKSQQGRLFVKTFTKGIASEQESMKDRRRNGGTIPWRTRTTVDVDAITGEDIVSQDFNLGSRRLNSMLSVISSSANISADSSKIDTVDGPPSILGSLNEPETKLSASTSKVEEKVIDSASNNQTDKNFASSATSITEILSPNPVSSISEVTLAKPEQIVSSTTDVPVTSIPTFGVVQTPSSTPSSLNVAKDKLVSVESSDQPPITSTQSVNLPSLVSPATSSAFSLPQIPPTSVPASSLDTPSTLPATSVPVQLNASLTAPSRTFVSVSAAPFTVPQQAEKPPVASTPSFLFAASSASNVPTSSDPKPVFALPTSTAATTSAVSSASQLTINSPFTVLGSSAAASSSTAITTKPEATSTLAGGFSFGATPVVTSSSALEFPKTTSSVMTFGVSSPPTASVAAVPTGATSLTSATNTTSATADLTSKPTFTFGSLPTSSAPAPPPALTTAGGFSFQFGASTQSTVTAPKPQEAGTGFKFSFGTNKESTPLSQPSAPSLTKPPAFGEGFSFGAAPTASSQESKPMTFGTPTSLTPTLSAPVPVTGGFNFSANNNAAANLPKPSFGFGAASPSTATSNPLGASLSGGFSFGAKPAEPAPIAPPAPNLGSPFQFGSSTPAMPAASGLQPQQQQASAMGNPFTIGGAAEQKPILEERFSFGSVQSSCMSPLQPNPPSFGQPSMPTFGSPTVNQLQNPTPANPSLFQFGSTGGSMPQPGMSSGGFNFGGVPATGVPSTGFNFNPTGPSATTPFQFGAAPLQAPAMFSIGSGSTAPRSRPRNRRQK